MARRLSKDIPTWFKREDYAVANKYCRRDWAEMIYHRSESTLGWSLKSENANNIERAEFWREFLLRALPSAHPPTKRSRSTEVRQFIEEVHRVPAPKRRMMYDRQCILFVDLIAPDRILIKQFKQWLMRQRTDQKELVKTTGPKAANFELTPKEIQSWIDGKLLEVWDLDFYAEVFGLSRLAPATLCDALGIGVKVDSKEWAIVARKKAKALLETGEYLLY